MRDRFNALSYIHLALLSGIGWTVIYLTTLTQVHTFDALSYIFDISRKPWQESFHPHHLAYGPVGVFATWVAQGGDAAIVMQQINALAGAAGVALFVAIVGRRWHRHDLSLLASLALGGSYAFWYYAVEVEVYTLAAFFLLWMVWLVDDARPMHNGRAWLLGMAWCGAVLFHQTNVLMLIPLLVVAGADIRHHPQQWRPWLIVVLVAGGLVVAAYAVVMVAVSGFRDVAQMRAWLFHYADTGWWGGRGTVVDLASGISYTISAYNGGWLLLSTLLIGMRRRYRPTERDWWLIAWILCYGSFFFWWEPDNIEFWIALIPACVLLWGAVLAPMPPWHWRLCVALGLASGLVVANHHAITMRGDARLDLQRDIARAVAAQSQPADLLLIPDGLQELYLPYYEQRSQFLSVNALMTQYGQWPDACIQLQGALERTQQAGAAIVIADDFLTPSYTMQQRFGIERTVVQRCLAPQYAYMQPLPFAKPIPTHYQIPRPVRQLDAGMWRNLSRAPLGWQLTNAHTISTSAWQLRVENDPALVSPILDMPLPRYIGIRMQAENTADGSAQLFVTDQINQFNETHALRWELKPGMHEYIIDLQQLTPPPTRLVQLRLDPVAEGANGTVTIAGIWVP